MSEVIVEPVEKTSDLMLTDQLKRMDKPALRSYLLEFFGHKAEESVSKEDLAKTILSLNRARVAEAQTETKTTAERVATAKDPIVKIEFQNIESPGTDLEFCFGNAPKRFGKDGEPKSGIIPKYHLIHNETAEVPYSVFVHLNSLKVPEHKFIEGPDGQIKTVSKGWAKRFACQLLLTPEQLRLLGIGS